MACRGRSWLGVGLLIGLVGCTPSKTAQLTTATTPPPPAAAEPEPPEANLPRRSPKPGTCLALGQMHEQQSAGANISSVQREQHWEIARKSYQEAIRLDAKFVPGYQALAHLYAIQGDFAKAVTTYESALRVEPKNGAVWYDLGMCHCRNKKWEAAITALQRAVECEPENRTYATTLGHCQARAGREDESVATFEHVVGKARAHYNLARMLAHMKKNDLAAAHLRIALQTDPELAVAQQLLAQLEAGKAPANSSPLITVGFEELAAEAKE